MSTKLSLTINGKKHELDATEARRVFDELKVFFGEGQKVVFVGAPQPAPQLIIHEHHQMPVVQPNFPWPPLGPNVTCQSRS